MLNQELFCTASSNGRESKNRKKVTTYISTYLRGKLKFLLAPIPSYTTPIKYVIIDTKSIIA